MFTIDTESTAGNLLVMGLLTDFATTISTPSGWTRIAQQEVGGSGGQYLTTYYYANCPTNAVFDPVFDVSSDWWVVWIEFGSVFAGATVDAVAQNYGDATIPDSGTTATLSQSYELGVAMSSYDFAVVPGNITTSGWNQLTIGGQISTGWSFLTSDAPVDVAWQNYAAQPWAAMVMTFTLA